MTERDERPRRRSERRPAGDRSDRRRRSDRPTDHDDRPTTTTMTDTDRRDDGDVQRLADVDHTNPNTDRTFGGNFTFARGGAVAADGGRPDVVPEDDEESEAAEDDETADDGERETLGDVEHTPPNDSDDANRVFERGGSDE